MWKIIVVLIFCLFVIPGLAFAGVSIGLGLSSIVSQYSRTGIISATSITWSDGTDVTWSDGTIIVEN